MADNTHRVERAAERQAECDRTGSAGRGTPIGTALSSEFGGGGGEHRADGVVELADAGEAGSECHVGERQGCGLDEGAGGLGSLGSGQGQWARPTSEVMSRSIWRVL